MSSKNCDIHQRPRIAVCLYNQCKRPFLCLVCLKEHDDSHTHEIYDRVLFDSKKQEIIENYEKNCIRTSQNKENVFSKNKGLLEESMQIIDGFFKNLEENLKKKKEIWMEDLKKAFDLPDLFNLENSKLNEVKIREFKEKFLSEEEVTILMMDIISLQNNMMKIDKDISPEYFVKKKINLEFINLLREHVLESFDKMKIGELFSDEKPQINCKCSELANINELLNSENKKLKAQTLEQDKIIFKMKEKFNEKCKELENLPKSQLEKSEMLFHESVLVSEADKKWLSSCFVGLKLKSKLLFRASRDSFLSTKFHQLCDGVSPTLVLVKTHFNKIIGGYTPKIWKTSSTKNEFEYVNDDTNSSFLFSVTLQEKYELKIKSHAICNSLTKGPKFGGGHDLEIENNCNTQYNNYSGIGHSYQTNRSQEEFYGGAMYLIIDYEVYHLIES